MKLSGKRLESFLARPDPAVAAVLVFGPDRGLVREIAEALVRHAAGRLDDPFRVVEIPAAALTSDPARLADEAAALAFGGGRRAVRVRDAGERIVPALDSLFQTRTGQAAGADALVVVEAGELTLRSALRKWFEAAAAAAAIACYPDEGQGLGQVVRDSLRAHGLEAAPEVIAYLVERLGSDRQVTRREIEKLALYMGESRRVTEADVAACLGDNAAASLDAVALAVGDGDLAGLDRALERSLDDGVSPVALLRVVQRHFQRLHQVAAATAAGKPADDAVRALRPPLIFKVVDRFRRQVRRWPPDRLTTALEILTEAELDCKTTGMPMAAVCGRALIRVARAARR